ncbi:MAG: hypothetical protein JWM94_273 [Sphingomonas bacterium]|nr:hypothetical protein [Sphingomonas bacterium]
MTLSYNHQICHSRRMQTLSHRAIGGQPKFTPPLKMDMRDDREVSSPGID